MAKRRRSSENGQLGKRVRLSTTDNDRLTPLSDEILIRILHNLPLQTLLLIQTISHRFQRLALDSELWKSLYYDRFVLPRALRIPGMRATLPPQFSSRKSKWLEDTGLVDKGRGTNWKRQYKLRHNWARGACDMQEIHLKDTASVPEMLVKLAEGLVFTVDADQGLRIWGLKEKRLIASCGVDGVPTCLAVDEGVGNGMGVVIGFEDGSWGTWKVDVKEKNLKEVYRHPAASTGLLRAVAYSNPYVLTITDSQLLSLYTFAPVISEENEESSGIDGDQVSTATNRDLGDAPRLLASLKSHTSWPPLSLSIRTTATTIIASIAYSLPTYLSGYTVGLQELHLSLTSGAITFSRLTSALKEGFQSIVSSPTTSLPTSGTSTPSASAYPQFLNRPTSLSYAHPYILATHPDNTLTLYLCTSTASTLTITPGTKLWGHTSSVSSAEITPRGKAVSVSARGNELRVWELEGGFIAPSRKRQLQVGLSTRSVRIRPDDSDVGVGAGYGQEKDWERWQEESDASKRWVGFDEEMVIVLKEGSDGSQALMVYDFT